MGAIQSSLNQMLGTTATGVYGVNKSLENINATSSKYAEGAADLVETRKESLEKEGKKLSGTKAEYEDRGIDTRDIEMQIEANKAAVEKAKARKKQIDRFHDLIASKGASIIGKFQTRKEAEKILEEEI